MNVEAKGSSWATTRSTVEQFDTKLGLTSPDGIEYSNFSLFTHSKVLYVVEDSLATKYGLLIKPDIFYCIDAQIVGLTRHWVTFRLFTS